MALARKARGDQGGRRTVSSKIKEAIEGLALERPPLPVTSIYRQVCQFARFTGETAPSYWVVCDVVRQLPKRSSHACASGRQGVQQELRPGTPARGIEAECHVAG